VAGALQHLSRACRGAKRHPQLSTCGRLACWHCRATHHPWPPASHHLSGAGPCAFSDGSVVRCTVDGGICRIEGGGTKRWYSPTAFSLAGSPKPDIDAADVCTKRFSCPDGPPMPEQSRLALCMPKVCAMHVSSAPCMPAWRCTMCLEAHLPHRMCTQAL